MRETTPDINEPAFGRRIWRQRLNDYAQGFVFWLTLSITFALFIFYRVIGDRTWWSACVVIWPSFLWCLGLVPMTLLCFNLKRPRMIILALGAVLVFQLTTVEWRSVLRGESAEARARFDAARTGELSDRIALRIAVWNVADYMSNKADVLAFMAEHQPDLCFLQETGDGPQSFQAEDLTGDWEGFHWIDVGDCGVLSRYPITGLDSANPHRAEFQQFVELELPHGQRALLANVHLIMPPMAWNIAFPHDPGPYREGHRARVEQYEPLMDEIESHRAALGADTVILAGDFNVGADVHSLTPVRERLHDVWLTHGVGWGGTVIASSPMARIDHCWVSDGVEPVSARVVPTTVSDHRMLLVDLLIPTIASGEAL